MDKIIISKVKLNCAIDMAFNLFILNDELEKWLTKKAEVEPQVGGKYELFWEPDNRKNNSTMGCKILAIDQPYWLNFEWKGPVQFKDFMNDIRPLTNVTVIFLSKDQQTEVTLLHTGWREGEKWEEARQYFIKAWNIAFKDLGDLVNLKNNNYAK